jgi:hypothetical protein
MSNVMKDAFSELEGIWSRCIANDRKYMFEEILDLLKQQGPRGIRIRPVDGGELRQITLSKPTSVNRGFAIGLRYVKKSGRQTEDHFAAEPGGPIERYYKGSLEQKWPEYGGTHCREVVFTKVANEPPPTTSEVNTINLVVKKDQ